MKHKRGTGPGKLIVRLLVLPYLSLFEWQQHQNKAVQEMQRFGGGDLEGAGVRPLKSKLE